MYSSQFPSYLVPLTPECSPQHPTLEHPQPTFLPQRERPSFTPKQNASQNYSSVYFSCHIFLWGGPGSSVGIATGYGLDGPGIESR